MHVYVLHKGTKTYEGVSTHREEGPHRDTHIKPPSSLPCLFAYQQQLHTHKPQPKPPKHTQQKSCQATHTRKHATLSQDQQRGGERANKSMLRYSRCVCVYVCVGCCLDLTITFSYTYIYIYTGAPAQAPAAAAALVVGDAFHSLFPTVSLLFCGPFCAVWLVCPLKG